MTDQPSLFTQLREDPERRFGTEAVTYENVIPPLHADLLDTWLADGLPADLPTIEHALNMLTGLWAHHKTMTAYWLALFEELAAASTPKENQT